MTDKLDAVGDRIASLPPIVVLRLRNMTALDATGMRAIEDLATQLKASGRHLVLCGARRQPAKLLERAEFHAVVGPENIQPHVNDALARARALHAADEGGPALAV